MAYHVLEIANKLLYRADVDGEGELLTNMKLQKLLYYEQGFHLAYFGTPLFDEDIEAWAYGPVVPCVYSAYKSNGRIGIKPDHDPIALEKIEENLFNEVFEVYNEYSASGLVKLTHSESPWLDTPRKKKISHDSLERFFKNRLVYNH